MSLDIERSRRLNPVAAGMTNAAGYRPPLGRRACSGRGTTAERRGQRLAYEDALPWHRDALPIRLDQCLAAQVMVDDYCRMRKFLQHGARLDDRAVTSRRSRF